MLIDRQAEKSETKKLRAMREDELIEELSESIRKSDNGETKPAEKVSANMRGKYAIF
jgi:hypothetical protein